MGLRFNKSIKIGKYLRLNISRQGISLNVGKKGASVSFGNRGTYLNLSPALAGITGTGISYRKRIGSGFLSSNSKKKKSTKKKNYVKADDAVKPVETVEDNELTSVEDILQEYEKEKEEIINLHKYTDNVLTKKEFKANIEKLQSEASKEIYQYSAMGDEDIVENLVSTFMNNLELAYEVRVNYELEDNVLYVDLDLPEIEELDDTYPSTINGKLVNKKKTAAQLKEEYARMAMSLGVFLSANYFNLSSYIDEIVLSGFTTTRNSDGDPIDLYLYSVKYMRDVFEKTDLSKLDDLYGFLLKFENRINMSTAYNFKAIKPFEMEAVTLKNSYIDDAVLGLKELGYKASDINKILPKLNTYVYESPAEYLKEGLRLLKEEN
ncbi:MAG: DUF4236 domain-containing protein [Erysipelotrichaceae bacterium]|nr:DUF4236 domain-containing protein [Erysipelotrichaceae bacterium]